MKLVTMKELVRHDSKEFHAGETRMVDDETAELFCKHGWATADGLVTGERAYPLPGTAKAADAPVAADTVLEVKAGRHASNAKVG